jgi:pyridoxamine 5'-phosphate oxidase
MNKDLKDIRINYAKSELDESLIGNSPLEFFQKWMDEALESAVLEPTAMTLSTVSLQGKPSSRIVLLKGLEDGCFKFYTNYASRKGREIDMNPFGSLLFFWAELERQVRIEGKLEKLPREESSAYFQSRPIESQIGAYTSHQSSVLGSREEIENKYKELQEKFDSTNPLPLPEFWGGYKLIPLEIEFWQGRPSRLHDRIRFRLTDNQWLNERLAP